MKKRKIIISASLMALCVGCGRQMAATDRPSPDAKPTIEEAIAVYHRQRHSEDEKAMGVAKHAEFTNYTIKIQEGKAGGEELTVLVRPTWHSILQTGVLNFSGPVEWEEIWRLKDGVPVFVRISKRPGLIIFVD